MDLESLGFELGTFRFQSRRSTTELMSDIYITENVYVLGLTGGAFSIRQMMSYITFMISIYFRVAKGNVNKEEHKQNNSTIGDFFK